MKAPIQSNENFDYRLLDDLVSNYGEFTSIPNPRATSEDKDRQPPEPVANLLQEEPPEQSKQVARSGATDNLESNYGESTSHPNLPAVITSTKAENSESPARVAQDADAEQPMPVESNSPVVRKDGDLDRQLKKLIKDYGEYDLYSNQGTPNIKKAGILAFVILALVMSGIYFLKTPPPSARQTPAVVNTGTTQGEGKSKYKTVEAIGDRKSTTRRGSIDVKSQTKQ